MNPQVKLEVLTKEVLVNGNSTLEEHLEAAAGEESGGEGSFQCFMICTYNTITPRASLSFSQLPGSIQSASYHLLYTHKVLIIVISVLNYLWLFCCSFGLNLVLADRSCSSKRSSSIICLINKKIILHIPK